MNMNEKTNQILLEQNKNCHENSDCILCSPQNQVKGATWVHMGDIPKMKSIGWPLYYDSESNVVLISNQMGHYLGIGSTGSGKTQCAILNTIDIYSRMSPDKKPILFITDLKGEITQKCANLLHKREYELHIIDTRNPESSSRWNPISGIFDDYQKIIGLQKQLKSKKRMTTEDKNNIERRLAKLRERMERGIAELSNITISLKGAKEIGWPTGARNMMRAIIYTMLFDSENPKITGMTREKFTLENVARIAFSTEDDCEHLVEYLGRSSERFLTVKNALASNYNIRAKQTRDSYISSCNTPLGEYTSYSISALTSSSDDIDFERVACGDRPHAFILITDERNPTTNIFSMMFLNKMISDFVDYADNSPSKSLTRDVVCLCDEFANMPEFPAFANKITTLRSRRIWLNMMIQSLSQLKMVYGEEISEIVQDNCDFQVYLGSNNQKTKEAFADSFGKKTGVRNSFSISNDGSLSGSKYTEDVSVVKKSDLEQLQLGEFYVRSRTCGNLKSYMTPYFMRKDIEETQASDHKMFFHSYDSMQNQYDIQEVLRKEQEAAPKTQHNSKSNFDLFSLTSSSQSTTTKSSFFDGLLKSLEKEEETTEIESIEPYAEAITNEIQMLLWRTGFDKTQKIYGQLCSVFPNKIMTAVPTVFSEDENCELTYSDVRLKLVGFENEVVDMIITDKHNFSCEECVEQLKKKLRLIKRIGASKPFCDAYLQSICILKEMSDEEFEKRKGDKHGTE